MKNLIAAAALALSIAAPASAQSTATVPIRVDEFDNPIDDVKPNTLQPAPDNDSTYSIQFGAIVDGIGGAKSSSPQTEDSDQSGDGVEGSSAN